MFDLCYNNNTILLATTVWDNYIYNAIPMYKLS